MIHLDFTWDLDPSGILLDEELNIGKLNWHPGDVFVLEETYNGRLFLKKKSGISKFILDSVIEKDRE
jgi:hypothetical protein